MPELRTLQKARGARQPLRVILVAVRHLVRSASRSWTQIPSFGTSVGGSSLFILVVGAARSCCP